MTYDIMVDKYIRMGYDVHTAEEIATEEWKEYQ